MHGSITSSLLKTSKLEFWELTYIWTPTDSKYTIILALILMPLGALNAKEKWHLTQYPQVRMTIWNKVEYIPIFKLGTLFTRLRISI